MPSTYTYFRVLVEFVKEKIIFLRPFNIFQKNIKVLAFRVIKSIMHQTERVEIRNEGSVK